jgi:hypothetical protein
MSEDSYHRLFDALAEIRVIDPDHWANIQLHGNAAGRALRSWALRCRLDVVPAIGELPDRTWSQLEVTLPNDVGYLVVVHLDDNIPTATAPLPAPDAEQEIPF